jgi:hypothetical protein
MINGGPQNLCITPWVARAAFHGDYESIIFTVKTPFLILYFYFLFAKSRNTRVQFRRGPIIRQYVVLDVVYPRNHVLVVPLLVHARVFGNL